MLEVQDLAISRGGQVILSELSFMVAKGECLIIKGPNGIGKTTLLKSLVGLIPATQGRVSLEAENFVYASYNDGVKAMLSVSENLRFWSDIYGATVNIDDAMSEMNLTSLADRLASDLSSGQRRRLSLARLLVSKGDIWVLDEPVISLDEQSIALFIKAVERHLIRGGAAIIASHVDLSIHNSRFLSMADYWKKAPSSLKTSPETDNIWLEVFE